MALIDEAGARSLTVMIMEVPCCRGLLELVRTAARRAGRTIAVECIVVGVRGDVLGRQMVCSGQAERAAGADRAGSGAVTAS